MQPVDDDLLGFSRYAHPGQDVVVQIVRIRLGRERFIDVYAGYGFGFIVIVQRLEFFAVHLAPHIDGCSGLHILYSELDNGVGAFNLSISRTSPVPAQNSRLVNV